MTEYYKCTCGAVGNWKEFMDAHRAACELKEKMNNNDKQLTAFVQLP